ncbi:uncharacterized protein cubi_00386 [Cryptosporidium ubiquitum]|uniref:Uncharacterized protein n=1 Tax=Cryptosporidium ubiquitum TaxID=857276 RepID=A0A1J4MEI1_9CRYT|nr:uncharacterized protein cubi_00386 [Cryptosporidium ubiquitum]OII72391.1 hypothetical protein cubi_00386 [Cryptosporidium ubiquitum]
MMKSLFLHILCLICFLNYNTFNRNDSVEYLRLSLLKVRISPGLLTQDSQQFDPDNGKETDDGTDGTDGTNGTDETDSSSSSSNPSSPGRNTNPFLERTPRPPSPYRGKSRREKLRKRFAN